MPIWILACAWLIIILTLPAIFVRFPTWKEVREDRTLRVILLLNFMAVWFIIMSVLIGIFT